MNDKPIRNYSAADVREIVKLLRNVNAGVIIHP
jgi:hypothetical protein